MTEKVDYDRVAPAYDRRYATTTYEGISDALLTFVPAGAHVLEVGCGTGHWLALLQSRGCVVDGVDASLGMLSGAREKAYGARLINAGAEALPLRDATFERIVCINAYHHFRDHRSFLAEALRTSQAAGGLMIIGLDPSQGRDRWCIYDYFPPTLELDRRRYPSAAATRQAMQDVGWVQVETRLAERIQLEVPARVALEQGVIDRRFTSQLTLLSDEDYRAGIARIEAEAQAAEARGEVLMLRTDVHLFATIGWKTAA